MSEFENAVLSVAMPVNAIAACNRLIELLKANNTNSITFVRDDWRVKAIVWWLMVQVTGEQLNDIRMSELFHEILTTSKVLDQ